MRSTFDLRVFRFSLISYKCMRVLSYWVLRLLRSPQLWSVKIIFPRWFWSASSESGFYLSSKFNNLITRVWIWAGAHWAHFKIIHLNVQKLIGPHVSVYVNTQFFLLSWSNAIGCVWVEIEREKNANPFNMAQCNSNRIWFGGNYRWCNQADAFYMLQSIYSVL